MSRARRVGIAASASIWTIISGSGSPATTSPVLTARTFGSRRAIDGIDLAAVAAVDDAGGELREVGERSAGGRQRLLEAVERGVGLRGRVAEARNVAVF